MTLKIKYIFFLTVLITFSFSASNRIGQQKEDGEILINILKSKEGIIDLNTSSDSLNYYFNSLNQQLSTKKTYLELFKLFSSTISKLQSGHTQLFPSKNAFREWVYQRKSLPFDYVLVGKKLFVNEIVKEDEKIVNLGIPKELIKSIPKNSEIIAIDHLTVPEMMEKIGEYISSDENGVDFKYFQAAQLFEFYRNIATQGKDSVEVIYSEKKDTSRMYFKTGIPPVKTINKRLKEYIDLQKKNQKDIGKFSIIKNKYACFKFVSFAECRGKKYEKFLEKSFEEIKKKKIEKLIVDVRGNNGGQMQFSFLRYILGSDVYLGKYQVNKPFKRFQNQHISKLNEDFRNYKTLSRKHKKYKRKFSDFEGQIKTAKMEEEFIFKGKIIVITDQGSFSAASMLACHLKTLANAKIVGETAGGSFYCGNAGTLHVKLPYTNFKMTVNPNTFYSQLERVENSQLIKIPDLIIHPITPKMTKKDDWFINKACKAF